MFEALINNLRDTTKLCIASSLTCDDEWIATKTISQWKKYKLPDLQKKPSLFLFLAS